MTPWVTRLIAANAICFGLMSLLLRAGDPDLYLVGRRLVGALVLVPAEAL